MVRTKSIKVVKNELSGFTATQIRRFARNFADAVVEKTPRKSGWAQSNWRMSLRRPSSVPLRKPHKLALPVAVTASEGRRETSFASISRLRRLSQDTIYVSNRTHYINKLNAGSSLQAAALFIETTLERQLFRAKATKSL